MMSFISFILVTYLNIFYLGKVVYAETKDSSAANDTSGIDLEHVLSKFIVPLQINTDNSLNEKSDNYREDMHLSTPQLLKKYGYPVEKHEVKTNDGYLLTMFRIPKEGPAVLVTNGGSLSSDEYLTIGPQAGLAYQLADAGFDVWLGNCRGNKYSLGHVTLPTSSAAYWDFTWDEMGRFDTPALIDHILNATNAKDLKLIGYSQSTTVNLVLCSEKPEYNDKVSVMILLSPTVFLSHSKVTGVKLLTGPLPIPDFYLLAKSFGLNSFLTDREFGPIVSLLKNILCATPETADIFCYSALSLIFGGDRKQINETSLPIIFSHFPTSVSLKQLQHYAQVVNSGKFRLYDYGKVINFQKYGSLYPPKYPLENVTSKVAVFWADNDWVCVEEDLKILLGELPNVIEVYKVPYKDFTHADFFVARDVKTLVYDKIIELLKAN